MKTPMTETTRAIVAFLDELETISDTHDELTDTDVREALHEALTHFFVWGQETSPFPRTFRMLTREGDSLVSGAFRRFLERVRSSGELKKVPVGQPRLDLLQGSEAQTTTGTLYDEFWGHAGEPLPLGPLSEDLHLEREYDDDE